MNLKAEDAEIYFELHLKLLNSLEQVRAAYDAGTDDWEYQLLTTFQRYCAALGIDPRLRAPILRMQFASGDRTLRGRNRQSGRPRAPSFGVVALAGGCAAVTVMHERGAALDVAADEVSRLTRIPAKRLRAQRDEFNRAKPGDRLDSYNHWLTEIRTWATFENLEIFRVL